MESGGHRFNLLDCLRKTDANRLETCGFLMASGSDHSDVIDISKWLPASTSRLSAATACYILQNIAPTFFIQLDEQQRLLDMLEHNDSTLLRYMPVWRRSENVRELCDVCQTTLYNLHLFCGDCGFAVCSQCVRQRNMQRPRLSEPKNADRYDRYQWPYCTRVDGAKIKGSDAHFLRMHHPAKLGLVALIPDHFPTKLSTVERLRVRTRAVIDAHNIVLRCVCGQQSLNERCFCAKPGPSICHPENIERLCDEGLLILKDPDWEGNLPEFQAHWHACKPVIVANVHDKLAAEMWTPEAFKESIR
uniref:Uncharacterized protein n=1 Tax=Plectus sambesii TaxID=2011161 RepID=A0A914UT20_9BILA